MNQLKISVLVLITAATIFGSATTFAGTLLSQWIQQNKAAMAAVKTADLAGSFSPEHSVTLPGQTFANILLEERQIGSDCSVKNVMRDNTGMIVILLEKSLAGTTYSFASILRGQQGTPIYPAAAQITQDLSSFVLWEPDLGHVNINNKEYPTGATIYVNAAQERLTGGHFFGGFQNAAPPNVDNYELNCGS